MTSFADRVASLLRHALLPGCTGAMLYRLYHPRKARFECPLCAYRGPFRDLIAPGGGRAHATCPRCGSNERGRLQYLVVKELDRQLPLGRMSMLHFSPEPQLQPFFNRTFGTYRTAGIWDEPVDFPADLTRLPFEDASWDCLYASHVLEHVADDEAALREIRRVLRPGGLAILPVPIGREKTVEYAAPNPQEAGHVRAPGPDYFDRYRRHFASVDVWRSAQFAPQFQLFIRGVDARGVAAAPQSDFVPVCRV
jgi:SAM-dependent methyltransferase